MCERYKLYRGDADAPHVVGFRSAYRSTQLSNGWVEGDAIRCMYHGWIYDKRGACIERLGKKSTGAFPQANIAGYLTRKFLGLIYAYFGRTKRRSFRLFRHMTTSA